MFSRRVWVCGVVITLLYWATWLRFQDTTYGHDINPYLKHIPNFLMIILVAIVGWFGWLTHPQEWIRKLWTFAYSVVISFLLLMGAIDILANIGNESFRNLLSGLRLFFTSPVPYGILMYLGKRDHRMTSQQ